MKKLLLAAAAFLFLSVPALATMRAVPLVNPAPVKVSTFNSGAIKVDQVRAAIIAAGQQHGWAVKSDEPGTLILDLDVRNKHFLEISVKYSVDEYTVSYVKSNNLSYAKHDDGSEVIHPSFSRWMNFLTRSINTTLVSLPAQK